MSVKYDAVLGALRESDIEGGAMLSFKGSVANISELPNNANAGDVYAISSTGEEYFWDGEKWADFGVVVDLSGYVTKEDATIEKITNNAIIINEDGISTSKGILRLNDREGSSAYATFECNTGNGDAELSTYAVGLEISPGESLNIQPGGSVYIAPNDVVEISAGSNASFTAASGLKINADNVSILGEYNLTLESYGGISMSSVSTPMVGNVGAIASPSSGGSLMIYAYDAFNMESDGEMVIGARGGCHLSSGGDLVLNAFGGSVSVGSHGDDVVISAEDSGVDIHTGGNNGGDVSITANGGDVSITANGGEVAITTYGGGSLSISDSSVESSVPFRANEIKTDKIYLPKEGAAYLDTTDGKLRFNQKKLLTEDDLSGINPSLSDITDGGMRYSDASGLTVDGGVLLQATEDGMAYTPLILTVDHNNAPAINATSYSANGLTLTSNSFIDGETTGTVSEIDMSDGRIAFSGVNSAGDFIRDGVIIEGDSLIFYGDLNAAEVKTSRISATNSFTLAINGEDMIDVTSLGIDLSQSALNCYSVYVASEDGNGKISVGTNEDNIEITPTSITQKASYYTGASFFRIGRESEDENEEPVGSSIDIGNTSIGFYPGSAEVFYITSDAVLAYSPLYAFNGVRTSSINDTSSKTIMSTDSGFATFPNGIRNSYIENCYISMCTYFGYDFTGNKGICIGDTGFLGHGTYITDYLDLDEFFVSIPLPEYNHYNGINNEQISAFISEYSDIRNDVSEGEPDGHAGTCEYPISGILIRMAAKIKALEVALCLAQT